MPTITYHEFRPGKWVKLLDGKVVGPATAAEVAAWRREKAMPARIWEDVVATASRPPPGEVKVSKPPTAKPEAPAVPGARKEPDQSTVWEDLVKRTKPSVQAEGPPERHPRKEDTDWAEQVQTWANVAKRAKKPEHQPIQTAPVPPKPASAAKPGPAAQALKPMAEAKGEQKPPPVKRAPEPRPAPRPAPPKLTTKAEGKPPKSPVPVQKAIASEPPSAPEAAPAKAMPQKAVAKVAPRKETVARQAKQAKATRGKHPKPATKGRLPAKLLDEIAEQKSAPPSKLPKQAATRKGKSTTAPKARSRPTPKAKTATAQERPNQLYLWIAAGQTDELVATVRTGLARYQERFGHPAEVVLCHGVDLPALEGAKLPVDLREGKSLAPRNFWIGLK